MGRLIPAGTGMTEYRNTRVVDAEANRSRSREAEDGCRRRRRSRRNPAASMDVNLTEELRKSLTTPAVIDIITGF